MLPTLTLLLALADISVTATGCVTSEAFEAQVRARVRPDVFGSTEARIHVTREEPADADVVPEAPPAA